MQYYVDKNIKDTVRIFPMQGRYSYYRFDMNENPEGLPSEFVEEVKREITPEFLSVYPEPDCFLNRYAEFVGVSYDNVVATNGSDMAIRYLLETFGEKGKNVVTVSPSFEMYAVNCSILGLLHKPVFYDKDMSIDVQNIVHAIDSDTRIVVLLNPNNPMGNVYTDEELQIIIDKAEQAGAIVIIDEAYHYFYSETFLKYAVERDNVVILRTFSKLFSIAACRLGVIISNAQLISYVKRAKLTFDVNAIALLFGSRILEYPEMIQDLIAIEQEGKAYTLETLREHGYMCKDCKGNYIFIKPNHDTKEIEKKLKEEKNILIHSYNNELLRDYIRVSVGSKKMMNIFLDAFFEVDK